jgi:uncharacterized protein (UPF0335 family)
VSQTTNQAAREATERVWLNGAGQYITNAQREAWRGTPDEDMIGRFDTPAYLSALGDTVEAPEPVAWLHPNAHWCHTDRERIAEHLPADGSIPPHPLYSAAALAALQARVEQAEDAENEAKDCFWAVYPTYCEVKGHGISTEAARTELAARATAAEARAEALQAEIDKYGEALDWYGKMAADCRKISRDGEIARQALDRDGGSRARALSNAEGTGDGQ